MNGVSIIISILLLLLLGTALYKGIYRRNKINNPYTSDFEDMVQGNRPTMDGRNPITQTKEKVQQEIKGEEITEQYTFGIDEKEKKIQNKVVPPIAEITSKQDQADDVIGEDFEKKIAITKEDYQINKEATQYKTIEKDLPINSIENGFEENVGVVEESINSEKIKDQSNLHEEIPVDGVGEDFELPIKEHFKDSEDFTKEQVDLKDFDGSK